MPDIRFRFSLEAPRQKVFDLVFTSDGLSAWWTKTASGKPRRVNCFSWISAPVINRKLKLHVANHPPRLN